MTPVFERRTDTLFIPESVHGAPSDARPLN